MKKIIFVCFLLLCSYCLINAQTLRITVDPTIFNQTGMDRSVQINMSGIIKNNQSIEYFIDFDTYGYAEIALVGAGGSEVDYTALFGQVIIRNFIPGSYYIAGRVENTEDLYKWYLDGRELSSDWGWGHPIGLLGSHHLEIIRAD